MIPIYTTESVPIADANPIEQAWPVWTDNDDIGTGLDHLAHLAMHRGAHAIIALKITTHWITAGSVQGFVPRAHHVLLGTAVVLGPHPATGVPDRPRPQPS